MGFGMDAEDPGLNGRGDGGVGARLRHYSEHCLAHRSILIVMNRQRVDHRERLGIEKPKEGFVAKLRSAKLRLNTQWARH